MSKKTKRIELKTIEGNLIFTGFLVEEEVSPNGEKPAQKTESSDSKGPEPKTNGDPMTDAQKRYLFRILADQGIERDAAHEELKRLFGVGSLQDIAKNEASRIIQLLLENIKGGEKVGSSVQ